jgi:hypothetical protein
MTDRDVDVVLLVALDRNGEQVGDRPALHDLECIVEQAPFDVLRPAEVRFDSPAQLRQPYDLRVGQCRLFLALRLNRQFLRPASRGGLHGRLLGGDHLRDDLAAPHFVAVGIDQTRDQSFAKAEAGLH